MPADLPPFFDVLTFMSPLSADRAAALVGFAAGGPQGTVVDIGCGWAELLQRVVEATPGGTGLGIDVDENSLGHGRRLAEQRRLSDRITLQATDLTSGQPFSVEGCTTALCIGSSQACLRDDPADERMNYSGALRTLRELLPRHGRAVFGEGIWSHPPTDAAITKLGATADALVSFADLADLATDHGFAIESASEAGLEEWDEFESGFAAIEGRWLADHEPDHPDAPEVGKRAYDKRDRYLRGYRGILGFAYLQLVAI